MSGGSDADGDGLIEDDDFYAILNVARNATTEEIDRAFRRISRHYHPDRHTDPERKEDAVFFFRKLKRAHDVLTDHRQRAIYDTLGVKGLDVQGWQLVEYGDHCSAQQIREEYERLSRQRQVDTELERTNPSGSVGVTLNGAAVFAAADEALPSDAAAAWWTPLTEVDVQAVDVSQSVEAQLGTRDRFQLGAAASATNGLGSASVTLSWRRIVSPFLWTVAELTFAERPSLSYRLVYTLTRNVYVSAKLASRPVVDGLDWWQMVDPRIDLGLNWRLSTHLMGSIALNGGGARNAVTTSLVFDDQRSKRVVGLVSVRSVVLALRGAGVQLGAAATFAQASYTHRLPPSQSFVKGVVRVGTIGLFGEVAYERAISKYNTAGASCSLHWPAGLLSLKLKLTRSSQTYQLNVLMCDSVEMLPNAAIYGLFVPMAVLFIARQALRPYLDRWTDQRELLHRGRLKTTVERRRDEAARAVELMRDAAERSREVEERRRGLVIVDAKYGDLVSLGEQRLRFTERVIDVTIPLQCLVADSKLLLHDVCKSQLPGFYDPCPTIAKLLVIRYKFHGNDHRVVVNDSQPLAIPKESHIVDTTQG